MSFVGSTPSARTFTRPQPGTASVARRKNHLFLMPDADMDQAVDALMGAAYGSASALHGDFSCSPDWRDDCPTPDQKNGP
ncbi:hypothetical protein [Bradyrhizobium shewense]|uniref:hypothetical protein n=1 Tax=Bradyrhizobium shewense TaxID=1761772 RepID=UPI001FDA3EE9|nr:hypothetical protein [Bradyrhizobium shewense]